MNSIRNKLDSSGMPEFVDLVSREMIAIVAAIMNNVATTRVL